MREAGGAVAEILGHSQARTGTPAAITYTAPKTNTVASGSGPVKVPIDALATDLSPRRSGLDQRHLTALAGVGGSDAGSYPPIVVHRESMAVLDGVHRLAAARSLGHSVVTVIFFDGTEMEAVLEAISLNLHRTHPAGCMPLNLADRKAAATDLLRRDPALSDRAVGRYCGLSPATVASISGRRRSDGQGGRDGFDGRTRALDCTALRQRIIAAIEEDPEASLRAIARRSGASPETVRKVRRQRAEQSEQTEQTDGSRESIADPGLELPPPAFLNRRRTAPRWQEDAAHRATSEGQAFAEWFQRSDVDDNEWRRYVASIPLSRIYEVVDDARRRAKVWESLARSLESRVDLSTRGQRAI